MYTETYTLINHDTPDLSRERFRAELFAYSSPSLPYADAAFDVLLKRRVSPRGMLAIFGHESGYGRFGICATYDTKNPGNVRSSSTDVGIKIATPRGEFVKFDTWVDGWDDMAYRLISPDYPYTKQSATSIEDIIPIWAPTADGNDPTDYIDDVVYRMNRYDMGPDRYASIDGMPVIWTPAPIGNYNGPIKGYKWIIIHDIEGSADSGVQTLTTVGRQASVQFVNDAEQNRVIQLVGCYSEAWGCGNDDGNGYGLQIENPGFAGKPYDPAVVHNCGRIVGTLSRDFGIPLQRITTAQFQAGVPGILGHQDIKPQHGPAQDWHTDPGPTWPWADMMSVAAQVTGAGTTPGTFFSETGFGVLGGILANFEAAGGVPTYGYPLSWEFDTQDLDGKPVRIQWFERGRAEWRPGSNPDHYDVQWGLLGAEMFSLNATSYWYSVIKQNTRFTTAGQSWTDAPKPGDV